ncbi:hypothetical protein CVT24_009913 [Panaeolus cyanescens]|uniref:MHD domain-containing protein n=1 Tax=Panaeolus cyanescens TaxID=181874 RepID=A0A409WG37_9AGAR|nr:hypothetical protein CVT24_009913 [Panaeolus cyanescens]
MQSGFRSTSPSRALLHIDAFNNALSKAAHPTDVDPVIYVPAYSISDSPSACCHIACADMQFLAPISGNVDPSFALAFLQTFVDILHEYFGNLSAATLRDNFDVVYQLLEETLDSGGHPLTTSTNALRDIVIPPSILTKLLSVAGANITATINSGAGLGAAGGPFSSTIPWRKTGLRYTHNEIYFDIVEELQAVVNKHGIPLVSQVMGKIESNAKLSGTPTCLLTFTNPNILSDAALHPCVLLQRWLRDKTLSFVPPDGKFTLLEYRYTPSTSFSTTAQRSGETAIGALASRDIVPLPFVIKSSFDLQDYGGSIDISFTSRLTTRPIENVVIELNLGQGASGIKCVAGRGTGGLGRGGIGMDMPAGSSIGASTWNLRGSFTTPALAPRPSHAFQVRFEIQSHTFSALKVEQLKVTKEEYKPYKGVRGRSVGRVEWRW